MIVDKKVDNTKRVIGEAVNQIRTDNTMVKINRTNRKRNILNMLERRALWDEDIFNPELAEQYEYKSGLKVYYIVH